MNSERRDHMTAGKRPCAAGDECPLVAVHGRLGEVHRHWHTALDEYDDPDAFRAALNACIQAVRNTTFAVQHRQADIPEGKAWYEQWREALKADPIMRWLNEARVEIVHKEDLKAHSVARVSLIASYADLPSFEMNVPPLASSGGILKALMERADIPEQLREQGIFSLERRWVVEGLPDEEVLEALAHGYGVLSLLLDDAHSVMAGDAAGSADVTDSEDGRLPCMVASAEARTVSLQLSDSHAVRAYSKEAEVPDGWMETARARYGEWPKREVQDLRSMCELFSDHAIRVFQVDGYHLPFVFLLSSDNKILKQIMLDTEAVSDNYLAWRKIAAQVEQLKATAVITVAEMWKAPLVGMRGWFVPPSESPERVSSPNRSASPS